MKEFDEFVSANKDRKIAVTKLKNLANPENHSSEIPVGSPFIGQVTLRHFEESEYGAGFIILVNGGFTFRSSMVREVIKKTKRKWLAKTMNSIYRVEVVE